MKKQTVLFANYWLNFLNTDTQPGIPLADTNQCGKPLLITDTNQIGATGKFNLCCLSGDKQQRTKDEQAGDNQQQLGTQTHRERS